MSLLMAGHSIPIKTPRLHLLLLQQWQQWWQSLLHSGRDSAKQWTSTEQRHFPSWRLQQSRKRSLRHVEDGEAEGGSWLSRESFYSQNSTWAVWWCQVVRGQLQKTAKLLHMQTAKTAVPPQIALWFCQLPPEYTKINQQVEQNQKSASKVQTLFSNPFLCMQKWEQLSRATTRRYAEFPETPSTLSPRSSLKNVTEKTTMVLKCLLGTWMHRSQEWPLS